MKNFILYLLFITISACGGNGTSSTPAITVNISENLTSTAAIPTILPIYYEQAAFNETNPVSTSNLGSDITINDSFGTPRVINLYFSKKQTISVSNGWSAAYSSLGGTQWEWFAVVNASDTRSGSTEIQAGGRLEFNSSGALNLEVDLLDDDPGTAGTQYSSPTGTDFTLDGRFTFVGGATLTIVFNFGTSIAEGGTGLNGTVATAAVCIYENLDPTLSTPPAFDVTNPQSTSNFDSTITIYDSIGNSHLVKIYFRKNATITAGGSLSTAIAGSYPAGGVAGDTWGAGYGALGGNEWEWYAVVSSADNANSNFDQVQVQGRLEFNTDGALHFSQDNLASPTGGFDFAGGASQNQAITFDFGEDIAVDASLGLYGTLQKASFTPYTEGVNISENLDPNAAVPPAFDVTNPNNTSNDSSSITVYDSLGNTHVVNVYYRKGQTITSGGTPANSGTAYGGGATWSGGYGAIGGNEWEWYAVVSSADNANSNADQVQARGRLEFNTVGALYYSETLASPTGGFDFSGSVSQNQSIVIDFGEDIANDGGTGLGGTTQL